MRKKKGPPKKTIAKAIGKMALKAGELGWSQHTTIEESRKAIDEPKFVYVKLDRVWGPWKRRGGAGNNGGLVLAWGAEKVGFGELTICITQEGKVICDTECMGGEKWARAVVSEFLKGLSYDPPGKPL